MIADLPPEVYVGVINEIKEQYCKRNPDLHCPPTDDLQKKLNFHTTVLDGTTTFSGMSTNLNFPNSNYAGAYNDAFDGE